MLCKVCNTRVRREARACPNCGALVTAAAEPESQPQPLASQPVPLDDAVEEALEEAGIDPMETANLAAASESEEPLTEVLPEPEPVAKKSAKRSSPKSKAEPPRKQASPQPTETPVPASFDLDRSGLSARDDTSDSRVAKLGLLPPLADNARRVK